MRQLLAVSLLTLSASVLAADQRQGTPPAPQTPSPQMTFRVEGNYIEVDAVVTDSQGKFVPDLEAKDFEVFEDKKPRTVDVFTLVNLPVERADAPLYRKTPIEPDVVTNEKPVDGRLYVLVLDAYHVPASDTAVLKRSAHQFINDNIGANDLAAVVLLQTGRSSDSQDFTSSKPALNASVDKFIGEKIRSKALNVLDDAVSNFSPTSAHNDLVADARDKQSNERADKASSTIQALSQLSTNLAGIRGRRKALVFFSEGLDFNTDDIVGSRPGRDIQNPFADNSATEAIHASMLLDDMQRMYETASRANVAIYSVDPRGPTSPNEALIDVPGLPQGFPFDLGTITQAVRDEFRRADGTLRTFAEATGGMALVGTNDFAGGFRRIVDDNSTYYVLGYHATDAKHDGKFHEITVRVNRPGVQVRARKGYYAAKDSKADATPPDTTISLLNSPLPVSGLGMKMTLATMKGSQKNVHVDVILEFSGSDVMPSPSNAPAGDKIELSFATLDLSAKVVASGRKTLDLNVRPETRQAIADHGIRLVTGFDVPPGRYQFRIAAQELSGGKSGSVFSNLDVPDFSNGSLTMGTVAIASTSAVRTPTSFDTQTLKDVLPGPPTANREFSLEDTLALFAEVYDNDAGHPHSVDLSATIRSDDGTQVFVTRDERNSQEIKADRGGYTYTPRIPLHDLVPGRYVLTVEAKSRLGGQPVTKEIEFTIK